MTSEHPDHPMVVDVLKKAEIFDVCAAKFNVLPVAIAAS
jgi:coatomer subunit epsilon